MIIIAKGRAKRGKSGNGKRIFTCDNGKDYTPEELGALTGVTGATISARVIKYGLSHVNVLSGPAIPGRRVDGKKKKSKKGRRGNCHNRGSREFRELKGGGGSMGHLPDPGTLELKYLS